MYSDMVHNRSVESYLHAARDSQADTYSDYYLHATETVTCFSYNTRWHGDELRQWSFVVLFFLFVVSCCSCRVFACVTCFSSYTYHTTRWHGDELRQCGHVFGHGS